jgi:putative ABC transport system substrate-binding protein
VLMSANVDAYRDALKGFRAGLRHPIVAEYDMRGSLDEGRKALAEIRRKVKPDLILAVGVWALQVLAEQSPDVPVVYAMVLNPPTVIGDRRRNITGASMNVPVKSTMEWVRKLGPQIRRVGVVFNPAKTGYLIKQADVAAREQGLQLVVREIRSPREAISAVDSLLVSGIDALWIPPDETVLAPEVIQHMLLISYAKKLPVIGLSERQAELGATLSLQFGSSEDIGKQAAELANSILDGRPPSELPYTTVRELNVTLNLKAAQKLGLDVPESILAMATSVIQ